MVTVIVKNMETKESHTVVAEKTVGDLKSALQAMLQIPLEDHLLVQDGQTLLQEDHYWLKYLSIEDGTQLELYPKIKQPRNVIVEIDFEDDLVDINMSSEDLISTLKKEIDRKIGLSPFRQKLTTLGVPVVDSNQVRSYVYRNSNPVMLLRRIPQDPSRLIDIILVTTAGRGTMKVLPSDTIYYLHGEIRRSGIAINDENYYLSYKRKVLKGEKTFQKYGIKGGINSVLRLNRRDTAGSGSPPSSPGSPAGGHGMDPSSPGSPGGHRMDPEDVMID